MLLLALDTSTRQSSIALCADDELYCEYTWYTGTNHSVELLQNIQHMLAERQLTLQDVEAVAVAIGPGSFNGVRVALATAKALSFALRLPLLGVGTLDIVAAQQQQWRGPICAVMEAGRSELYAACYTFEEEVEAEGGLGHRMKRLSDYLLLPPQQLVAHIQEHAGEWVGVPGKRQLPPFLFCGEISVVTRQTVFAQMQELSLFVNPLFSARRASVLAQLALRRLREGHQDDALSLEPLYLRRPSITKSTRKRALLGGSSS